MSSGNDAVKKNVFTHKQYSCINCLSSKFNRFSDVTSSPRTLNVYAKFLFLFFFLVAMTMCFEASGLMQLLKIRRYTHKHMAFCCFYCFICAECL